MNNEYYNIIIIIYFIIQAACRALETAIQQGHKSVELRTDSTYTIRGTLLVPRVSTLASTN